MDCKTKPTAREFFNPRKVDSSKEISRLILYIAFGILAACFTIFRPLQKCLLITPIIFSGLSILLHFTQYLSLYYTSYKYIDSHEDSVPDKPFVLSDVLFIAKVICIFFAAISFITIALLNL
jgi:hypothetical protein